MFKQATKSHQHKKTIKLSVATASVEQISPAVCVCVQLSPIATAKVSKYS